MLQGPGDLPELRPSRDPSPPKLSWQPSSVLLRVSRLAQGHRSHQVSARASAVPAEHREPAGLPAETAAPHAGPARQNPAAAQQPGPGAAGGPGPRPTLRRSSRPRGRRAARRALLPHPPPPPSSRDPQSSCSLETHCPRGRTAGSPRWPPPLAKEEPYYRSATPFHPAETCLAHWFRSHGGGTQRQPSDVLLGSSSVHRRPEWAGGRRDSRMASIASVKPGWNLGRCFLMSQSNWFFRHQGAGSPGGTARAIALDRCQLAVKEEGRDLD
jgi:hypothetical protein